MAFVRLSPNELLLAFALVVSQRKQVTAAHFKRVNTGNWPQCLLDLLNLISGEAVRWRSGSPR